MIEAPDFVTTATQHTACLRVETPWTGIQKVMGPGLMEVRSYLAQRGITPAGPWFNHYLTLTREGCTFEISVPVAEPVTPSDRILACVWPAMEVARTIYHGPYEQIAGAWGELERWIRQQGRTPAPDVYERYLVSPEQVSDSAEFRTELNWPLAAQ